MIRYQRESARSIWDEIQPLLEAHYSEIAHYKDIPLDPDKESYFMAEDTGFLRCYTARDEDLVGYAIYFVKHNLHYKNSLQADQDVLFLLPEYRKGRVGLRLIRFSESELQKEGVQVIYQHVKKKSNLGLMMTKMGYELVDEIYARRLD